MNQNNIYSHKHNFKNTAVIGGAQVVQILAGIIRGKFVAVLLGPIGMGINGILNSVIGIIAQVAGMGLNFSMVRNIAQSKNEESPEILAQTISVMKRWLYFSALLGALATAGLSYFLSFLSFDNNQYTWAFVVLSIAVGLNVLNSGNMSILQGLQKIRQLAFASLLGSLIGLVTSIPLYYMWGLASIPYAIVAAALTAFVVTGIMVRRLQIPPVRLSAAQTFAKGKDMASLGLVLMIANVIGMVVVYAINAYITHSASLVDLGFYQAGISITTQYSGLIFTAMATEYFPRLSGICKDSKASNSAINQQIEISLLIITPIVLTVVMCAPLMIRILLSEKFMHIQRFVELMAVSIVLKGASFPIGFLSFARGDKRIFFWLEGIVGSSMVLLSGVLGFWLWGLNGIAYFTVGFNVLYLFIIKVVAKYRYNYQMDRSVLSLIFLSTGLSLGVVVLLTWYDTSNIVIALTVSLLAIAWYVYKINKIINIVAFIRSKISKNS